MGELEYRFIILDLVTRWEQSAPCPLTHSLTPSPLIKLWALNVPVIEVCLGGCWVCKFESYEIKLFLFLIKHNATRMYWGSEGRIGGSLNAALADEKFCSPDWKRIQVCRSFIVNNNTNVPERSLRRRTSSFSQFWKQLYSTLLLNLLRLLVIYFHLS
jgi:hypothetical protein